MAPDDGQSRVLVPTSVHADGRPGFWTLVRHEDQLIVLTVWDDVGRGQPDVPPMRLEEQRDGTWVELRATGRTGGASDDGRSIATYTYRAEGDPGMSYRFTA